ncbi:hypothetical protein E2C01_089375 [Portunus trituberculatus]|uniref:Uncharacterized protein n=1 Tax=Portunus trituberculatus TaxID=210409 RepID=A0A5B7JM84_PORTR|nr:hypothetical protein [Portunus trituberculatus]
MARKRNDKEHCGCVTSKPGGSGRRNINFAVGGCARRRVAGLHVTQGRIEGRADREQVDGWQRKGRRRAEGEQRADRRRAEGGQKTGRRRQKVRQRADKGRADDGYKTWRGRADVQSAGRRRAKSGQMGRRRAKGGHRGDKRRAEDGK